jgi:hypothetical protein
MQVIAVPAHFDDRQRSATLEAAQMAGLSRVQLLQGIVPNILGKHVLKNAIFISHGMEQTACI